MNSTTNCNYLLFSSCKFDVLNYMPLTFTITTKNNSCKFNTHLLAESSIIISNFLKENPNTLQYHLDINDDQNVLLKFEKLYQDKNIRLSSSEYEIANQISDMLQLGLKDLKYINNQSNAKTLKNSWGIVNNNSQIIFTSNFFRNGSIIKLNPSLINSLITKPSYTTFLIITKKQEYRCNTYTILSSSIIREFISTNPKANEYVFDYDDTNLEFQLIADFFNSKKVTLTIDNVDEIKEIAELLGIDCILQPVNDFIGSIEKVSQSIDDNQTIIESINDLFDLLYHIKEKTVELVSAEIEDSQWLQTIDKISELSSYILQVVNSNIELHQYLIDLLIILRQKNETSKNLIQFIVDKSMSLFKKAISDIEASLVIPFVYKLYKNGLIEKEKIDDELKNCGLGNEYFVSWFLPELIESNTGINRVDFNIHQLILKTNNDSNMKGSFSKHQKGYFETKPFYKCNAQNIEEYKQMRDKDENDNLIEKALRNDDVETFQSIVSKNLNKLLKEKVKKNIFEPFIDGNMSYLNYAAYHQSVKCFKYLLLNKEAINRSTFEMSIIGGNTEIIRIISNEMKGRNDLSIASPLYRAIKMHKNDIFDWIIDENIQKLKTTDELLSLIISSISYANTHSFVYIIDKGFNFNNYTHYYSRFVRLASEKGFYSFVLLIINLINNSLNSSVTLDIICSCITIDSVILFQLIDKINAIYHLNTHLLNELITKTSKLNKIDVYKKVTNLILKDDPKSDFTKLYIKAIDLNLPDLIQEFIDKKCVRDDSTISSDISQKGSIDSEIFMKIFNDTNPYYKAIMIKCINKAIIAQNKPLIKFLLKEDAPLDDALYHAVETNDFEIVEMILQKNSEPSFINKLFENIGTALNIAIKNDNLQIVKKLLSIPGIDPSLYYNRFITPLVKSAYELKYDIFNSIIEFYGENIKQQKWQLKKAVQFIIDIYSSSHDQNSKNQKRSSYRLNNKDYSNNISISEKNNKKETIVKIKKILLRIFDLHCINPNIRFDKSNNEQNYGNNKNWVSANEQINIQPNNKCTTPLLYACQFNLVEVVESLIKYDSIDMNIYSPQTGNTPLITSIVNISDQITNLLINHPKTNINAQNYKGESALIIASRLKRTDIVHQLLINDKFNPKESNINYAFYISNLEELLTCKSLDVNYTPLNDQEDIIFNDKKIIRSSFLNSIIDNNLHLFDLLIQHPSFKLNKLQLIDAVYIAFKNSCDQFIPKLINLLEKLNIDINCNLIDDDNFLFAAIKCNSEANILASILNNPNFDSKKSDIVKAFNLVYSQLLVSEPKSNKNDFCYLKKTKLLDLLYDYDIHHEHLIDLKKKNEGKSLLSTLYSLLFIKRDVDPNEPNEENVYPLEYAIQNDLYVLSLCLINSHKIDFNKDITKMLANSFNKFSYGINNNYLSLAACCGRNKIVEEILSQKLCDVNITNKNGETALFGACKNKNAECVKILFKMDDLDYKHRNIMGQDVLQVLRDTVFTSTQKFIIKAKSDSPEPSIESKDEYLSELLKLINTLNGKDASSSNKDQTTRWGSATINSKSEEQKTWNKSSDSINYKQLVSKETKIINNDKNSKQIISKGFKSKEMNQNLAKSEPKSSNNENQSKGSQNEVNSQTTKSNEQADLISPVSSAIGSQVQDKKENSNEQDATKSETNVHTIKSHEQADLISPVSSAISSQVQDKKESPSEQDTTKSETNVHTTKSHEQTDLISPVSSAISSQVQGQNSNEIASIKSETNSNTTKLSNASFYQEKTKLKPEKDSQKTKFEIYNESFTEKPDPSFQSSRNDQQQKSQIDLVQKGNLTRPTVHEHDHYYSLMKKNRNMKHSRPSHRKRKVKRMTELLSDDNDDDYEDEVVNNQSSFYEDQMQFVFLQQQQWYHMIQANNELQAQINMQMISQQQNNKKMLKKSKKKK